MNPLRHWRELALTLTVLVFAGCASTGAIHTTTPITAKSADYKTVLLSVSSEVAESSGEAMQLASFITTELRDKGLFEKVRVASSCRDCPECRSDLQLNAKIVEVIKEGPDGNAGVVVDVALTDVETGKGVGSFKAEGKSSSRTVPANRKSEAVEHAAEQIVKFVAKSM
ncbi:MAG: hypothetical protein JRJ47_14160 [Deltaproteobacteria bacterium]|nr:hypothetical protein [Deltaproteobacteria bacterium]